MTSGAVDPSSGKLHPTLERVHILLRTVRWPNTVALGYMGASVVDFLDAVRQGTAGLSYFQWDTLRGALFYLAALVVLIYLTVPRVLDRYFAARTPAIRLAGLIDAHVNPFIKHARANGALGMAWHSNLTIFSSLSLISGWSTDDVKIAFERGSATDLNEPKYDFNLLAGALGRPEFGQDLQEEYEQYVLETFNETNQHDSVRLMLTRAKAPSTDDPGLGLVVAPIHWSVLRFFWEVLMPRHGDSVLQNARNCREIVHPNSLVLHLVVIDADDQVLVARLSGMRHDNPGTWACTLGEQLDPADLKVAGTEPILQWVRRAVEEELPGIETRIDAGQVRFMALNLETDIANYAVVCVVRIALHGPELLARLNTGLSLDQELESVKLLDLDTVPSEILAPSETYPQHPSTGIRLIYAYLSQRSTAQLNRALLRSGASPEL